MRASPKKKHVLHLSTHLGGGIGRVVLNYLAHASENSAFSHSVMCLGYVEDHAIEKARAIGVRLDHRMAKRHDEVLRAIGEADIVLVHWWGHPLVADFLAKNRLPHSRIIIWSHVSGFYAPQVFTKKLLEYPDMFVFTTPISLSCKDVTRLPKDRKDSLRVIWSTGGVEHTRSLKPEKHDGFNIGYIGTVDFAKIHRNFVKLCSKIDIPDVRFIVCGHGAHTEEMRKEALELELDHKFTFAGYAHDISEYLPTFDLFGYPLSPEHYGTCDQVLAESMAAGVVPVSFANPMERYMVKHGKTGYVAKNEDEYVDAVMKLYEKKSLRDTLSKNARSYAVKTFSVRTMSEQWERAFKDAVKIEKKPRAWPGMSRIVSAAHLLVESLGRHGQPFKEYLSATTEAARTKALRAIAELGKRDAWKSNTKATVHNYHSYFPDDRLLALWSRHMKKASAGTAKSRSSRSAYRRTMASAS